MKQIVLVISALLAGCATQPRTYNNYSKASTFDAGIQSHYYIITAIDADGTPISGAIVTWEITANDEKKTETIPTDDKGKSIADVRVKPVRSPTINWADYKSEVRYSVSKSGYFTRTGSQSGSSYVSSTGGRPATPKNVSVVLTKPDDYLSSNFANEKQSAQIRQKVLTFLTAIRLESLLNEADLKLRGIHMQDFKGKRYLTIELNSDNVFNSLKLDGYGVGKKVFDETVRKILNPLNDNISDARLFYGYNIIVNAKTRNFTDQYSVATPLKYEFMMPQSAVRSYKDKDISGQKLIDDSIVLLNDERIDLKLQ